LTKEENMTQLKKLSLLLVALILIISIESCKSEEGNSATDPVSSSLVGTWVLTKITVKSGTSSIILTPAQAQIESTIIAKADLSYTATVVQGGITTTEIGTYTTGGNKITFKRQDGTITITDYTLSGNKLVVVQTIMTSIGVTPADLEFTKQ
jgi:hypothetical protein